MGKSSGGCLVARLNIPLLVEGTKASVSGVVVRIVLGSSFTPKLQLRKFIYVRFKNSESLLFFFFSFSYPIFISYYFGKE